MSAANVETVRRIHELGYDLVAPDAGRLEKAFRELLEVDFEITFPPSWPEGEQVFRGRGGFERMLASLRASWAEWQVEPEALIDAGEHVVALVRMKARGASSGAALEFERGQVWGFRNGRAASLKIYEDHDEALADAGVSR
jgi:ketosteroid isomerase-like protein